QPRSRIAAVSGRRLFEGAHEPSRLPGSQQPGQGIEGFGRRDAEPRHPDAAGESLEFTGACGGRVPRRPVHKSPAPGKSTFELVTADGRPTTIAALPIGQVIIVGLAALIFLGVAQRVLDRMRLTDTAALVLLGAMFVAPFIPNVNLGAGIRVDLAGFLVPLGVAAYLIITADQAYEKIRGVTAALITGAAVFAAEQLLPPEPTQEMLLDVDPLWLSGLVAGVVGYLSGRSRRASFIAGVGGVALADMAYAIMAAARGTRGAYAALGGGGAFDSTIIAGVLAVALAELVGETREYFARRRGGAPAPEGGQARRAGAGGEAGGEAAGEGAAAGGSVWTASFLGLGISAALVAGSVAAARVYGPELPEHIGDRIYRMIDETGDPVTASALPMSAGDQWIDADN